MMRILSVFASVFAAAVLCGCFSIDNNYLEAHDLAEHLKRAGLPVGEVRQLPPDPFRANSAVAFKVGDSEIGVYKYDRSTDVQKRRIEKLAVTKRTYIAGIPYPIEVCGSFMIFGLEKNKHKRAILKSLESFK